MSEPSDSGRESRLDSGSQPRLDSGSQPRFDSGPRARPEVPAGSGDPPSIGTITRMFRLPPQGRLAGQDAPVPAPRLRMRLRTKLVVALVLGSLVPILIVALLATGVILSSLEASLGEDAARQLTVGLNLVLRSVERLGDECVQLAESGELGTALDSPGHEPEWIGDLMRFADPLQPPAELAALDAWIARQTAHVPSARLQVLDARGDIMMNRTLGGADARFVHVGVAHDDPLVAAGKQWGRGVSLVTVGDMVVMRAVSPILDTGLTLRGMVVMSTPLDGDFADAVKGALSADVLLGGTSGTLAVTMHSPDFTRRAPPLVLSVEQRVRAMSGERVFLDYDVAGVGSYKVAVTALRGNEGRPVGLIGVALDRGPLERTKALAVRTLIGSGLAALACAVVLALFWARRLGAPIARLHEGAIAVSLGDLEHRIDLTGRDELADLAAAFNQMTSSLKDNQARLAARMREIVALHDAGRAVSSVIDLDPVARKIVDAVARTFDVQLVALWLVDAGDAGKLAPFAARARRSDVSTALATDEALSAARALQGIAERVRAKRAPLRLARAGSDPDHGEAAVAAGAPGPFIALPLERKARVGGVLVVGRAADAREFSDADLSLLTTFADQAGAAVENARLYSQVRDASEELEKKVQKRTHELTAANEELGKALADLRETQAQLVLSERMAGLGVLVAGVAHEIDSPTAAIRGSIAGLGAGLSRVTRHSAELAIRAPSPAVAAAINAFLELTAPQLAERPLPTSLTSRRAAREVAAALERAGIADAPQLAADLADLGATAADAERLAQVIETERRLAADVVAALTDRVYLHRTDSTVRDAVQRIQRIVGALKTYSHLDQQALRSEADLHEGIETTLVLLHHTLRDIVVERRYGSLPRVPVYVDELNQVWTNLIANAQQALQGKGTISLETAVEGEHVAVRVIDDGPGVPPEIQSRIFEPFFTTKPKGEGTGLGLGISRRIVDKHGGEIRCTSQPGRTVFEVRLPVAPAGDAAARGGRRAVTRREVIVCIDDEEGVLRVLRAQLGARFGHECQIATARSGDEAVALFDELTRDGEQIAVVIADQIMPGMKGVELLEIVDRRLPDTMKILLTGQAGLDAVIDAINRAHLNQYVGKPWDETALLLGVETLLRQYRLVHENHQLIASLSAKNLALLEMNRELEAKIHERTHELAEANARLAQLAVTDGLTGLYNHRHFHERLALEVERSQRNGLPLSLLMLDVDHFKQFNDTFGHPAGDEVLRQLARVLADTRRANDVVARYGGEEFAVILVDTAKFTAAKVAERVRERVFTHDFSDAAQRPGRLSVSVGVATFPDDGGDAETLVRSADTALYAAKHAGRNRVVIATEALAARQG